MIIERPGDPHGLTCKLCRGPYAHRYEGHQNLYRCVSCHTFYRLTEKFDLEVELNPDIHVLDQWEKAPKKQP